MLSVGVALLIVVSASRAPAAEPLSPAQRRVSLLGLVPERATFVDAARVLGKTEVRHNLGDAAASTRFACYVGPDGTALVLASNEEMNGGTVIDELQLVTRLSLASFTVVDYTPPQSARPRCASAPKLTRAAAIGAGVRLGMTRDEVVRVLGPPSRSDDGSLVFTVEDRDRPVREGDAGVAGHPTAGIALGLERGRVVRIAVWYSSAI